MATRVYSNAGEIGVDEIIIVRRFVYEWTI